MARSTHSLQDFVSSAVGDSYSRCTRDAHAHSEPLRSHPVETLSGLAHYQPMQMQSLAQTLRTRRAMPRVRYEGQQMARAAKPWRQRSVRVQPPSVHLERSSSSWAHCSWSSSRNRFWAYLLAAWNFGIPVRQRSESPGISYSIPRNVGKMACSHRTTLIGQSR